jgi:hypothetical protein
MRTQSSHAMSSMQAWKLGRSRLWQSDRGEHPWPQPMPARWMGQFGTCESVVYTQLEPVAVVEFGADRATEYGRSRHTVRLLRLRIDLNPSDVSTLDERFVGPKRRAT